MQKCVYSYASRVFVTANRVATCSRCSFRFDVAFLRIDYRGAILTGACEEHNFKRARFFSDRCYNGKPVGRPIGWPVGRLLDSRLKDRLFEIAFHRVC